MRSLFDKFVLPRRARKGTAGKETHAGCPEGLGKKYDKSHAGLEHLAGARIRKKRNYPPYFFKKIKISGGG